MSTVEEEGEIILFESKRTSFTAELKVEPSKQHKRVDDLRHDSERRRKRKRRSRSRSRHRHRHDRYGKEDRRRRDEDHRSRSPRRERSPQRDRRDPDYSLNKKAERKQEQREVKAEITIPTPEAEKHQMVVDHVGEEDEEKLIEERRRKRMEILQKYKKEMSPVSEQGAVDSNASNVSVSPVSLSVLADEKAKVISITEPSRVRSESPEDVDMNAADYDPNADKIEDENRIAFLHGEKKEEKKTDVDDMFAADDDFDMFGAADGREDDIFSTEKPEQKEVTHILESKKIVRPENMSLADNWDDVDGYYKLMLGEMLDNRYHVYANLGKGVFSNVVKAKDTLDEDKDVAIKIIRNNDTMYRAGMKEANILKKLATIDPEDKKHVIRLKRSFEHRNHLCLVFESLSMNLRDVIKKFGKERGLHIKAVRSYAHQLFLALSLLKKGNVLHADIKPDNVLVAENNITLKLCDLGSASDASENEITPYLVSRFYRAPEIILGLQYDFGIDIWSVACTLYELYTGKILFPGKTNNQMLKLMQELKGRFPSKQLRRAQFVGLHFDMQDPSNAFLSLEHSKTTGKDVVRRIVFKNPERDIKSRLAIPAVKSRGGEEEEKIEEDNRMVKEFADLLEKCLVLNPEKRMTVAEALRHPFIMGSK